MAINPANLSRISNLMRGNIATATIGKAQRNLAAVQQQLTTGKRLAVPSDDAGDAAIAQQIRKLLEQRQSYTSNLKAAQSQLSEVDTTLSSVNDLLREAQQVASQNVGSDVSPEERRAAAEIIDSIYSQVLTLANKSSGGLYLFAGDRSTDQPFVEEGGGVKWNGSSRLLSNRVDEGTNLEFMIDGADVFGALATRVRGSVDATPAVTGETRLIDLAGALGKGVGRGTIRIGDGTANVDVDLSDADSIGDVIDRINNAGLSGVNASLGSGGAGLDIAVGGGTNLTIVDVGGGTTAQDLGIRVASPAGVGVGLSGGSVGSKIVPLTLLSSLKGGVGIDRTGLTIRNGQTTKSIDLSTANTVEDMLNAINNAGVGVKAQINPAGSGIDVFNAVQGTAMTISELTGTTAADLGLRSMDANTKLAEINDFAGVKIVDGAEFRITDSLGVAAEVELDGAATMQDVIDAINAAAGGVGAGITASFSATTNNLILTDSAGGGASVRVTNLNGASAVSELGLDANGTATELVGRDVNPINSTGMIASLIRLRDAMRGNDQRGITRAAELLDANETNLIRVRGEVGAKVQEFEDREGRIADQNIATQGLLSELEDTDFTSAIVKFQTLQTSLQASMQATGRSLNLSLMDFLG